MTGLKYDFDVGDITLSQTGQFDTAQTDNQCVALIAVSQVCRLTYPYYGAQIGARLMNVPYSRSQPILSEAKTMAQKDGAVAVDISIKDSILTFSGYYGQD